MNDQDSDNNGPRGDEQEDTEVIEIRLRPGLVRLWRAIDDALASSGEEPQGMYLCEPPAWSKGNIDIEWGYNEFGGWVDPGPDYGLGVYEFLDVGIRRASRSDHRRHDADLLERLAVTHNDELLSHEESVLYWAWCDASASLLDWHGFPLRLIEPAVEVSGTQPTDEILVQAIDRILKEDDEAIEQIKIKFRKTPRVRGKMARQAETHPRGAVLPPSTRLAYEVLQAVYKLRLVLKSEDREAIVAESVRLGIAWARMRTESLLYQEVRRDRSRALGSHDNNDRVKGERAREDQEDAHRYRAALKSAYAASPYVAFTDHFRDLAKRFGTSLARFRRLVEPTAVELGFKPRQRRPRVKLPRKL